MATASQQVGIAGHTAFKANSALGNQNAGFHNSIYRGKYLGNAVTAAQYAQISAGTFDDLFVGDYWTINSVNWRIAAFDYWFHNGDVDCTTHHVVIVPDSALSSGKMDSSNDTKGGYVGSGFYKGTNLDGTANTAKSEAVTKVNNAFGTAHILSHRLYLSNSAESGVVKTAAWCDSTVDLMSEVMVYGTYITASRDAYGFYYQTGVDKSQLPLFQHRHDMIQPRIGAWWLRDVSTSAGFANVGSNGNANIANASGSIGIRPAFAIRA